MKRLGLVMGGLLAGLLIFEIGLWVFAPSDWYRALDTASPGTSGRWQSHPFLPYIGGANSTFELRNDATGETERIVTNDYGFRAHPFPEQKNPDDFFVVCLGGSTTYGYKVPSNDQTWPEVLEKKLAERYPDKNVKVFNLGIDMATSTVSVVTLGLIGVHLKPDLVIAYHGYNDLAALGAANHRTDHSHFYRDLGPAGPQRGIQHLVPRPLRILYSVRAITGLIDMRLGVNDLSSEASLPRDKGPDPLGGIETMYKNFRTIRSMTEGRGGKAIFSTFQFRDGDDPLHRRLNDALRDYFTESGSLWVDQDALIPDGDDSINVDPCHFTQKGRDLMAQNFFDFIAEHRLVESAGER